MNADSVSIGEELVSKFLSCLPNGFADAINCCIKTIDDIRRRVKSKKMTPIIDFENICLHLLMIGQRRQLELGPPLNYKLCAMHPSPIDEHGCLGKVNRSQPVKRLRGPVFLPAASEILLVDVSKLFYRIV